MKHCTKCDTTKPVEDFHWKNKAKEIRNRVCKVCSTEYARSYYHAGEKVNQIARSYTNNKKIRQEFRDWKAQQECKVCGEDAAECLDLHHLDPNQKDFTIGNNIITHGRKKLWEEVDKCVVLCSNCHRKVHSKRITVT